MVTAAVKLKDACFLEEKLWPTRQHIKKQRHYTLLTKVRLVRAMVFSSSMYGCESWTIKKAECQRVDAFELWCWRRLFESPLDCKEIQPIHPKGDQSWILEGLMLRWGSNTLATWCEELTHLKRPWCWGIVKAGGEGDHRGWDGWMASPTQWIWVWVSSASWWWTGKLGVRQSMGLQSQAWPSNWTELS